MSNALNSISNRLSWSRYRTIDQSPQEDSIIEFLQNSGIEFETCSKCKDTSIDFNTGFGSNNDLYITNQCSKPQVKTPLYQENYLKEFRTEEEKAAARHALGLYNKGDVVAMSLLTAEEKLPTEQEWKQFIPKQLRKGDEFFSPITSFSTVYDSDGKTLETRFNSIQTLVTQQQKEITKITSVTEEKEITSLGDVKVFLQGFNNGDVLQDTLGEMNQEMLRFEKTGQIQI